LGEFRLTLPAHEGLPYEIGQEIFLNPYQEGASIEMVTGVITDIIDIGLRVGLMLEVPDDSPLLTVQDAWIQSMQETL